MTSHVLRRCSSFEGTAENEETIDFPRWSGEVTITNDHASDSLYFKFDAAEDYMTVYAGETITVRMRVFAIIITANGQPVPYRIWVFT